MPCFGPQGEVHVVEAQDAHHQSEHEQHVNLVQDFGEHCHEKGRLSASRGIFSRVCWRSLVVPDQYLIGG